MKDVKKYGIAMIKKMERTNRDTEETACFI